MSSRVHYQRIWVYVFVRFSIIAKWICFSCSLAWSSPRAQAHAHTPENLVKKHLASQKHPPAVARMFALSMQPSSHEDKGTCVSCARDDNTPASAATYGRAFPPVPEILIILNYQKERKTEEKTTTAAGFWYCPRPGAGPTSTTAWRGTAPGSGLRRPSRPPEGSGPGGARRPSRWPTRSTAATTKPTRQARRGARKHSKCYVLLLLSRKNLPCSSTRWVCACWR